jgi:cation diffusion facilitator CzcD-associated flavoprotein CzcO
VTEARNGARARVVVIGAGIAGLTAAHHLLRYGAEVIVLEAADRVAMPWRRRHPQLRLNTHRLHSSLPGTRLPLVSGAFPGRDHVVAQLEALAGRLGDHIRLGCEVLRVDCARGGWTVATGAGALRADHVVIATGRTRVPHIPNWPGRASFAGELLHAGDFGEAGSYADKDILVVGAGNSAVDLLGHLARVPTGSIHLSIRTPAYVMPEYLGPLPTPLFAPLLARLPNRLADALVGAAARLAYGNPRRYGLPIPAEGAASRLARDGTALALDRGFMAMLKAGRIALVPEIVGLSGRDVLLACGTRLTPDVVIAATGYCPVLEPLLGHLGVLDPAGLPTRTLERSGLYFVGFRPTLAGTVRDADREARAIAAQVAGGRRARYRPGSSLTGGECSDRVSLRRDVGIRPRGSSSGNRGRHTGRGTAARTGRRPTGEGEADMKVMVIVKATAESEAGVMPSHEELEKMGQFNEELVKAGVMLAMGGLHPTSKGVRIRFPEGTVTDGPFAETKELIGGYWLWQVASVREAVDWLQRSPFREIRAHEVEIRPVFEADDFGEAFTPELRDQEARVMAEAERLRASVAAP